jgi:hypothetical protein
VHNYKSKISQFSLIAVEVNKQLWSGRFLYLSRHKYFVYIGSLIFYLCCSYGHRRLSKYCPDWPVGSRTGPCEDCGHPKNHHPRNSAPGKPPPSTSLLSSSSFHPLFDFIFLFNSHAILSLLGFSFRVIYL